MSKENHVGNIFYDLVNNTPSNFLCDKKSALEYLYFLNRTRWNNLATIDIFDYEKLIYIEMEFPEDDEIQTLITTLKENIHKNFKYKKKLITRIMDNNLYQQIMEIVPDKEINKPSYFMGNLYSTTNELEYEAITPGLDRRREV